MPTNNPGLQTPDFGIVPDQVTVTGGIGSGTSFPGQAPDMSQFGGALDNVNVPNFDPSSLDTPSFDFGTGSGSGSSLLSSAISTLTGGSGFGNLAAIGGEAAAAAYGLSEAKAAQAKAEQQAQQIMAPSKQYLDSSQQLLQQYFSQKLNANDQKFVDFATKEGQDVINSGQGMKSIADQQLGQFAKGQLLQSDQLELDRNTAAAKQQIADNMAKSGTSDSSIAAGYNQQIDEAAQIQKQKILNGYFQTGNQAYNSWLTSTTQGAQLMQQGAAFSHQAFQDMLSSSLSLGQVGMSGLTTAIGLEIQSDNELSKSVSELMANLASAFAYTVAGGGGSGSGGKGGGAAGILPSLVNLGKQGASLFKTASTAAATGGSTAAGSSALAAGSGAAASAGGGAASAGGATAFGTEAGIAPASGMTSILPANAGIAGSISNLGAVGTGAVDQAVLSAGSDAAAALGGGTVGSSLGGAGAASGSFATGGAAGAGGGGAGAGAGVGAGVAAGVASVAALPALVYGLMSIYDKPGVAQHMAENYAPQISQHTDPQLAAQYGSALGKAQSGGGMAGIAGDSALASKNKGTYYVSTASGKRLDASFTPWKAAELYNAAYVDPKLKSKANIDAYLAYMKQHGG